MRSHALRGLVLRGVLTDDQGTTACQGFIGLALRRFSAQELRPRMWALRHDLSGYDATYVALAETIGATSLLTIDSRLARAPGIHCRVDVL